MGDVLPVARRAVVGVRDRVVDRVVESEVPRQREVVVALRHVLSSQHGVHLPVRVVERVLVLRRYRRDVVDGRFAPVVARFERIAERPARRDDAAREEELVVTLALGRDAVGVERQREVDAEIVEQRRTERDRDVRKSHRVGQEVVRTADAQFVDQLDLLHARGVAFRQHLHFEVLRQREVHRHRPSGTGYAVCVDRIGRIGGEASRRVGLPGLVVAVFRVAEVRRVGESDRGGERVADGLYLAVFALLGEVVHAVYGRRCRDVEVVVVEAVKPVLRRQRVDLVRDGVPVEFDFFEVPLFVADGEMLM